MEKEFDFNSVGKRLPYDVKDGVLEEISMKTLHKAHQQNNRRFLRRVIGVAASLIIVCCATAIYYSTGNDVTVDELITNMSDNELEVLVSMSDSDILFNEEF